MKIQVCKIDNFLMPSIIYVVLLTLPQIFRTQPQSFDWKLGLHVGVPPPHDLIRSWVTRLGVLYQPPFYHHTHRPSFSLVLSKRQHYQLCQIHRQQRSGTLFLTCPSAPIGIPLMRHYGEQMQRGQPGQKQPATVT